MEIVDVREGMSILQISGDNASSIFKNEAGCHSWQRTPPNERNGRVHTSTITVAVLKEPSNIELQVNPHDLTVATTRGSGNGGQNKNKTETCVIITHIPTKTTVRCESERSQFQNREIAMKILRSRLWDSIQSKSHKDQCAIRNSQIGSSMRGEKRRTIRVQHNIVADHITGKKWRYEDYCKGNW